MKNVGPEKGLHNIYERFRKVSSVDILAQPKRFSVQIYNYGRDLGSLLHIGD